MDNSARENPNNMNESDSDSESETQTEHIAAPSNSQSQTQHEPGPGPSGSSSQSQHEPGPSSSQSQLLVPRKRLPGGKVLPFDLALWNSPAMKRAVLGSLDIIAPKRKYTATSQRRNPETGKRETKTKERAKQRTKQTGGKVAKGQEKGACSSYMPQQNVHQMTLDDLAAENMESDAMMQLREKLAELKANCAGNNKKSWAERMEYHSENWQEHRPEILSALMTKTAKPEIDTCLECGGIASIQCIDCEIGSSIVCSDCDIKAHSYKPFHRRSHWMKGFIQPAPNDATVCVQKDGSYCLKKLDKYFAFDTTDQSLVEGCKKCNGSTFQVVPSDATYIAVTLKGRFVVRKQQMKCDSPGCKYVTSEIRNLIRCGFWPGSLTRIKYIFAIDLLEWISTLTKHMPGTSLSAFAKAIQDIGQHEDIISKVVLARVLHEYQYCNRLLLLKQDYDSMKCPPCSIQQQAAHVDGNFKVYRYSKVPRGTVKALNSGTFIAPDEDVNNHFENVNLGTGKEKSNNTCGGTVWRAANSRASARVNQDQTGLEVAGCRHALAAKACNMYSGEQYAYPHFLHMFILLPLGVKTLWQDVICRYWPWAKRQTMFQDGVRDMKPALSIMHSKAHAWDCQIIWGGRYQSGVGTGTGEEMEQFFSHLSRLGSTTKNMSVARREDTITEHVFFWNTRKIKSMASQLCRRFWQTSCALDSTKKELSEYLQKFKHDSDNLEDWHEEIKQVAEGRESVGLMPQNELMELYELLQQEQEANVLSEYPKKVTQLKSLLTGKEDLLQQIVTVCDNHDTKKDSLRSLSDKLTAASGMTVEDLYKEGEKVAVARKITNLKATIEISVLGIKQREEAIKKMTDSCKQRARLRSKNTSEKIGLEKLLKDYIIIEQTRPYVMKDLIKDVMVGNYPWHSNQELDDNVPFDVKKTAVDMFMFVTRCREELEILRDDMRHYLEFYQQSKNRLKTEITNMEEEIMNPEEIDYRLHGELALKKKGMWFADTQLGYGHELFEKCLEDDWREIDNILDEDELYEDDGEDGDFVGN